MVEDSNYDHLATLDSLCLMGSSDHLFLASAERKKEKRKKISRTKLELVVVHAYPSCTQVFKGGQL